MSSSFRFNQLQRLRLLRLKINPRLLKHPSPKGSLKNWTDAAKKGKLKDVGRNQKPLSETELELARARRELAEARMERDFLKKCAAYFAKESGEIRPDRAAATDLPSQPHVSEVSESGHHAWRHRPHSERRQQNARLEVEILATPCIFK